MSVIEKFPWLESLVVFHSNGEKVRSSPSLCLSFTPPCRFLHLRLFPASDTSGSLVSISHGLDHHFSELESALYGPPLLASFSPLRGLLNELFVHQKGIQEECPPLFSAKVPVFLDVGDSMLLRLILAIL
jgi:hypothetical protein